MQSHYHFKASGKVLLAGGYGVLEEGNYGLSIAIDRHFYSRTQIEVGEIILKQIPISVSSRQIKGSWSYTFYTNKSQLTQTEGKANPFVENAVKYALIFGLSQTLKKVKNIKVEVVFDRGYLSQGEEGRKNKEKFINYGGVPSKTGLGSSACVTVVVLGGILKALLDKEVDVSEDVINILSQVANIAAQNKIGSNFDISTAVYGSQLYKNVLPNLAFRAVEDHDLSEILKVDPEIKKIKPNPQIFSKARCWLLDLKIGSNTRTMVKGFIKTLKTQPIDIIEDFYVNNKLFVTQLYRLLSSELNLQEVRVSLLALNKEYRRFLQKYSDLTNVPVEPSELRPLLDQISDIEGVFYCICPGSGGYDAVAVLGMQGLSIDQRVAEVCKKRKVDCQISAVKIEWKKSSISEQETRLVDEYLSFNA